MLSHILPWMLCISDILGDCSMLRDKAAHLSRCMFCISDILGDQGVLRGASVHLSPCMFCASDILVNWGMRHIFHPLSSMFQIFWAISACFVVLLPIFQPVCSMFQIFWAIEACSVVMLSHISPCMFCISDILGDQGMLRGSAVAYFTLYVLCFRYPGQLGHAS